MKKVLLIEDDLALAELIEIHLSDIECDVTVKNNGRQGFEHALEAEQNLILLDVMLPEMDGMEICKNLRTSGVQTPILMLTSKSEEIDKVLGLELGADDYMTKPFSVRELTARVKAIFRRIEMEKSLHESEGDKLLRFGKLLIDIEERKVLLEKNRVDLTPKEFDLLALMASRPGKSFSREQLLQLVWGYQYEGYEHTVNSHINRLRAKIEPDMSNPTYILTTWGIGYRFTD